MTWAIRFGFLALAWLGAFGIAFAVVEWRDGETSHVDPAQCQAAVALFEAIDAVLERASNPTENLREEWAKAAANMDVLCFAFTATPPSD